MSNLAKYYDKLKYELDLPVEFLVDDNGLVELLMERYNNLQFYCRKLEDRNGVLEDLIDGLRSEMEVNKY